MRCKPLAVLVVAASALAGLPAGAWASPSQISIFQDEPVLRGFTANDPEQAMLEVRILGADMVRTFVYWTDVAPSPRSRKMPRKFVPGDPNSPGYNWSTYDAFVERAERYGLEVYFTLSPPLPYWASEEPQKCPHPVGGRPELGKGCFWRPRVKMFGEFAKAVARRYRGRVSLYSLWNEPNLEHYLYPQFRRTRFGVVDVAAKRYRRLWYEGWKAIATNDPTSRGNVLFGETAAISSPMDTLRAALCLNPAGRPFRGKLRRLQGCRSPRKLPVAGFAHHPYGQFASGGVFQRTNSNDSLPLPYLGRLHRLIAGAARHGRIPPRRGIYISEFGFQSKPPDRYHGLGLGDHARALNEAERLFYRDRRIRSVAQFQLYDSPEPRDRDLFNTGLRLIGGGLKPAYRAYRLPLTVERLAPGLVRVWGQVRPARRPVRVTIDANRRRGGARVPLATVTTSRAGFFSKLIRGPAAPYLRYRAEWRRRSGEIVGSRVARAGRPIRYLG